MRITILFLLLVLIVVPFVQCQDRINLLHQSFQIMMEKQEAVLDKVKEIQEKLDYLESSIEELHHEMEHVKGGVNKNQESLKRVTSQTKQCVQGLEDSQNVTLSGQQNLKSSFHQEISEIVSLLQTESVEDECSEGSHNCGLNEKCTNTLLSFTCSCLPGFSLGDSGCQDIDECSLGISDCSPNASCKNTIGGFSCHCNMPLVGDGRTCQDCKSPNKEIKGLGCIGLVREGKSWQDMNDHCKQNNARLLQDFSLDQLQDLMFAFESYVGWIGVKDRKWQKREDLVEDELWYSGYQSDPSQRCGDIVWESSSAVFKLDQIDCSWKNWGYCQFTT